MKYFRRSPNACFSAFLTFFSTDAQSAYANLAQKGLVMNLHESREKFVVVYNSTTDGALYCACGVHYDFFSRFTPGACIPELFS